jgi:hypothetical protein
MEKKLEGIPSPLSLDEAAAYLKMTPEELRRRTQTREQLRAGEFAIPFYKIGHALYFTQSTLAEWVTRMKARKPVFFQAKRRMRGL